MQPIFWRLLVAVLLAGAFITLTGLNRRTTQPEEPDWYGARHLRSWTDEELLAVWSRARSPIERDGSGIAPATAARARQLLLAEIERRYPAEAQEWLRSGAALADSPPSFLNGPDS